MLKTKHKLHKRLLYIMKCKDIEYTNKNNNFMIFLGRLEQKLEQKVPF
jgi:hypothetical protein